jgi:hypothetical protein
MNLCEVFKPEFIYQHLVIMLQIQEAMVYVHLEGLAGSLSAFKRTCQ